MSWRKAARGGVHSNGKSIRWLALFAFGPILFAASAHAQSQLAQSREDLARKFRAYLASAPYATFIAEKVMAYDEEMPPACEQRRLTGQRRLFAITRLPRFIETRQVPVAGEWAERLEVQRCGRRVWHNVYLKASRARGLHAVVGFPGRSLTNLNLQLRAGRAFLKRARRAQPECKRLEIIAMRVSQRPPRRGAPWSEIWTAWMCGRMVTRPIRFVPRGRNVVVQVE